MRTSRVPVRLAGGLAVFVALCHAQDMASKMDEYVQAHVRKGTFTGSILVSRNGTVILSKGYGMANRELDVPNTPKTKFRLGSITKQFTAMAILQLAEHNRLSLEDTASKYVPDSNGGWKKVTIRHLLTHTSGIPSFTSFPDYKTFKMFPATQLELIARFKDKPLEFEPGEKYRYSNSGYFLLGYIVSKVSGKSYEDYVRENIFEPLGMKDSGSDSNSRIIPNRAAGYTPDGKGGVKNADYIDMSVPTGAGDLYSTTEDLSKWDQALYTSTLLPAERLETMFTPYKNNYAFGWMISKGSNHRSIGHGGGIEGFNTMIARYPDGRVLVVVLSNTNTPATGRMAKALAAIVFGEPYEKP